MNHWCNVTAKKAKSILGYINKISVWKKRKKWFQYALTSTQNWGLSRKKITGIMVEW